MPISLGDMRYNAFCQLDRLTVRRRKLLALWLEHAVRNLPRDCTDLGLTNKDAVEISRSLQDFKAFCVTNDQEGWKPYEQQTPIGR